MAFLNVSKSVQPLSKNMNQYSENVDAILERCSKLSPDECFLLSQEIMKFINPSSRDTSNLLSNLYIKKEGSGFANGNSPATQSVSKQVRRQSNIVDSRSTTPFTTFQTSDCEPSFLQNIKFIYRNDLAKRAKFFVFDVEKCLLTRNCENKVGSVALINDKAEVVLWALIKQNDVCRYVESVKEVNGNKTKMGNDFLSVTKHFAGATKGKTVWGTNTENNLRSLGLATKDMTFRDLQTFFTDATGKRMTLSFMSSHFLGINIQELSSAATNSYCALRDARLILILKRKLERFVAIHPKAKRLVCPSMESEGQQDKWNNKTTPKEALESCSCGMAFKDRTTLFSNLQNSEFCLDEFELFSGRFADTVLYNDDNF